jgi:hypothetical protein
MSDWEEETAAVTASAGCMARQEIRSLENADTGAALICVLDFNHDGVLHYDASDQVWWTAAESQPVSHDGVRDCWDCPPELREATP